jgi:predicted phage replisome organizer
MADNVKWFKLMNNMFEDEKIEYIESLPDGETILLIWIKTLCLASKCNDNGNLMITRELPYTPALLAHKFKKSITQVEYAFNIMQGLGMIELNDNILCVSNWCKYQSVDELAKIREQTKARVAKCREKKKLKGNIGM